VSGLEFDFSDINKLAADLSNVAKNAGPKIRKAVEVSARNVKEDWRKPLQGSGSVPGGAASISYDIKGGNAIRGSEITAEIGPELGGAGSLVSALEDGFGGRQGPTGFGAAALQMNQEDFVRGLEIALQENEEAEGL
jgi:hypothetical protein